MTPKPINLPASPQLPVSDGELLDRFRATRAEGILADIIQRHHGMVYRTCLRLLANRSDAEDASQAVFIALARRPPRGVRSLAGWLHEVARNLSIKMLRSRTRRAQREKQLGPQQKGNDEHPLELREELDLALDRLPGPLREAVVLCYVEGRAQEEAAALAGCPRGTLAWRASQGLEQLRTILAARGTLVAPAALAAALAPAATAASVPAPVCSIPACSAQAVALADTWNASAFGIKLLCGIGLAASLAVAIFLLMPTTPPTKLRGHTAQVTTLAYSPDGRALASASRDGTIKIWEMPAGRERLRLRAEDGRGIVTVAISRDGQRLAAGQGDTGVWLWNAVTGELRGCYDAGRNVSSLVFSPRDQLTAVGTGTPVPFYVDFSRPLTAPFAKDLPKIGPEMSVPGWGTRVAYSANGKLLAVAGVLPGDVALSPNRPPQSRGATVSLYEAGVTGKTIARFPLPNWRLTTLAFSPDSRLLAAANDSDAVALWDLTTLKELWAIPGGDYLRGAGDTLAFAPDSKSLALIQADGNIGLYDAQRFGRQIAVALLDVRMPGLDGPRTLTALQEINPEIAFCFMSGHTGEYTERELLQLGAVRVFGKPFPLAELGPFLRRLATQAHSRRQRQ